MKRLRLPITIILIAFMAMFLTACADQGQELDPGDPYTVTFVDHDGTVLKEIDCIKGQACEIEPPAEPNTKENAYFTRWSVFPEDFDEIESDTTIEAVYTLDNRVFVIGENRAVMFYSFFILTGIIVGLGLGIREFKRLGMTADDLIDGFLWIVPVSILGARLWYVVFEWDRFFYDGVFPSILRALGFQSGTLDFSTFGLSGLAIHGAFVTAVICAYFYARKRKLDLLKIVDVVAVGFIIAQAFGRWGNFFNQEAHGGIVGGMTDGAANLTLSQQFEYLTQTLHIPEFIANNMYITKGLHGLSVEPITGFYHPTFLYESMLNLVGFGIMLVLRRLDKTHFGDLLAFYLIWYGGVRIFIETMRTDPLLFDLFGITFKSAIVTSVIMILLGIGFALFVRKARPGDTYGTIEEADQDMMEKEGAEA